LTKKTWDFPPTIASFHQQDLAPKKMGSAPSERVELRDITSKGKDFNSLKMKITIF
jgi:hypothetical protein